MGQGLGSRPEWRGLWSGCPPGSISGFQIIGHYRHLLAHVTLGAGDEAGPSGQGRSSRAPDESWRKVSVDPQVRGQQSLSAKGQIVILGFSAPEAKLRKLYMLREMR